MSPQEILIEARRHIEALGSATVYRAIRAMVSDGALHAVEMPGEPARYELSGKGHHHHFHCTKCDRVFDMPGCDGRIAELAPAGFTVERHEVILYGQCAACAKSK